MWNDIRYALRTLRGNPGFALVAILSLALGVGANTTIYSLAEALMFRPIPTLEPSRVVTIGSQPQGRGVGSMSYRDFVDFRAKTQAFESVTAFQLSTLGFARDKRDAPQVRVGFLATADFFRVMRVTPALGRVFQPEEDRVPGRDAVAVISHTLWQRDFEGRRDVIGRTIFLNGVEFTVIGVTPERFTGVDQYFQPALYVPMMMAPRLTSEGAETLEKRDARGLLVRGRLKPGVGLEEAGAEARIIARRLEQAYPATNRLVSAGVQTEIRRRMTQSPGDVVILSLLMGLAAVVLLIACANIANLLLSRARARAREMAVRLAIGAGRGRLIRQLLAESLVISVFGGAAGLLIARTCIGLFSSARIPSEIPITFDVRLDARVAAFAALASLLSAVLFGLVPALQASKTNLVPALKSGDFDPERRRRLLGRNALVVVQVAGSLLLLVCATQFYRACSYMLSAPPGFRSERLLLVTFDPSLVRYTPAQAERFYRQLLEKARVTPGVESAALTRMLPLSNWLLMESITPEGRQLPPGRTSLRAPINPVSEGYFETIGIPIVQGRGFARTDAAQSSPVAVINETYAQHYYPGQNPVGKRLRIGEQDGRMAEIVGVARTSKYQALFEPPLEQVYLPLSQAPQMRMTLALHTAGASAAPLAAVREAVRSIDPDQPIYAVYTVEDYFHERARTILNMLNGSLVGLCLLGLALAMVGLYGIMSYSVSRRTREIGIRMAIGADRGAVTAMVLRRGMLLASIGAAIGLALSLVLSRTLAQSQGVPPFNAPAIAVAVAALLATAALSAYLPARRASRIDPIRTLRLD